MVGQGRGRFTGGSGEGGKWQKVVAGGLCSPLGPPFTDFSSSCGPALCLNAASGLPGRPVRMGAGGDACWGLLLPSAAQRPLFPQFCPTRSPVAVGEALLPAAAPDHSASPHPGDSYPEGWGPRGGCEAASTPAQPGACPWVSSPVCRGVMPAAAVSHQNPSQSRAGRTDPLCLGAMGAPVPADKEPLDCADSPGAELPAHPPAAF